MHHIHAHTSSGAAAAIALVLHLGLFHPGMAGDHGGSLLLAADENQAEIPTAQIYSKNDILFCTGESMAARENNRAASLMEAGDFSGAADVLEAALMHAPLFFPYRYNLGMCRLYKSEFPSALLHLKKALHLVPEYSRTYIQIAYIYDRLGEVDTAIDYYRSALRRNPKELEALTLIGDLYFNRKQVETASQYYSRAIEVDHRYPNGLLGMAKIHFYRCEYFKAMVQIKSIDLSGDYDKALHYYYAESAYKLKDYQTAYDQYTALLRYRTDKFFLTNSLLLIQHKLDLCRRFVER